MTSMQQVKKVVYVNDNFDRKNNVREINANYLLPVTVETSILNWHVSSNASIKQVCLERICGKRSRLTTLAQFPAGRAFKKFGHEGGVEFLVLSGIFSDADGDYSSGYYVRNPAKMYHEPYTRDGCVVLFKLGQFQPLDRKRVVIDTSDPTAKWVSGGEPGVSRLDLHHFAEEAVCLYRIRPECWVTFKNKNQGVEIYVCEGSISINGYRYETGTWLRYPAGKKVKISTRGGACLYYKKCTFPT
jgi:hypothetical protein